MNNNSNGNHDFVMVDYPLMQTQLLRASSVENKEAKRTFRMNYPRLVFCKVGCNKGGPANATDATLNLSVPNFPPLPEYKFDEEENFLAQLAATKESRSSRRAELASLMEKKRAEDAEQQAAQQAAEQKVLDQSMFLEQLKQAQQRVMPDNKALAVDLPPPYDPSQPAPAPRSPALVSPPPAAVTPPRSAGPTPAQLDMVRKLMGITGVDSPDKAMRLLAGFSWNIEQACASFFDNGDIDSALAQIKRPSLVDPLANNPFLRPPNQSTLEIRLPTAPPFTNNFAEEDTLWTVYQLVSQKCNKAFTLQRPLPSGLFQSFTESDLNMTLKEAGLVPKGVIQVKLGDFR